MNLPSRSPWRFRATAAAGPLLACSALWLGACSPTPGDTTLAIDAQLAAAQQAMSIGDHEAATAAMTWLDATGLRHPALQYNLGLAALAPDASPTQLGPSVLALERAGRMAPRDPDIIAARDTLQAQLERRSTPSGWDLGRRQISASELGLMALLAWNLFWLARMRSLASLPGASALSRLALGIALLSFGLLTARSLSSRILPRAIVIAESSLSTTTGPGPADAASTAFALHPGQQVIVLDHRSGFARVSPLTSRSTAWVSEADIETIGTP